MKRHLMPVALLLGVVLAAQSIPTLPEGAYPEWSAQKAWQRHSATRSKVCLNGLWQFTSEKDFSTVTTKTLFADDLDGDPAKFWTFAPEGAANVSVRASSDTTTKTSGNASMRFDLDVKPSTNFYHVARYLHNLPTRIPIRVEFDAKFELEHGTFGIEAQDGAGWQHYTAHASYDFAKPGWKTYAIELTLPKTTKSVRLIVTRSQGTATGIKGSMWLDNFRVVQATRTNAMPPIPDASRPWGLAKVPGSWHETAYPNTADKARLSELNYAWLHRTADIPADWQGRRIFLEFDRASTHATVFVNGTQAGNVSFLGAKLDVTRLVTPGQKADILVFVESRGFWEVDPLVFHKPSKPWQQNSNKKGITGDVFLTSEPNADITLGLTRIATTTADMRLALKADVSAPDGTALDYTITVTSPDATKTTFTGTATARNGKLDVAAHWPQAKLWDIGQPNLYHLTLAIARNGKLLDETLPIRFGFRDFRIDGKHLLLNGVRINLQTATIWTRGNNWGTKDAIRHWLTRAQRDHFTFIYLDNQYRPDFLDVERHFLDVCDELGILAAISPLNVANIGVKNAQDPEMWQRWCTYAAHCVNKAINHPSLVLWRMNMNLNCYNQDQNPLVLDGRQPFKADSSSELKEQVALRTNEFVRSLDPTRPTYNHACGKIGEIYTLNNYLGWPEPQDLREWLRVWHERGDKPFMLAEQATPYPGDFQMRDPRVWWSNEPIMTEYGAIILGDRAYELEEDDYVDYIPTIWNTRTKTWSQSYGYFCSYFPPILDTASALYYEAMLPAWRAWGLNAGNNAWENTFRRPYRRRPNSPYRLGHPPVTLKTDWANLQQPGVSADKWFYTDGGGGEIRTYFDLGLPDDKDYYEPTLRAELYPRLIAPLFAYIAGPAQRWYTVEHAFYPGEDIDKTVIILNDTRITQSFILAWSVLDQQGNTIAQGQDKATVAPAEQARLPIAFKAPAIRGDRLDLTLRADVRCNGKPLDVRPFALQIHAAPTQAITAPKGWYALGGDSPLGHDVRGLTAISPDRTLPADAQVVVLAAGSLGRLAGTPALAQLRQRVRDDGLRVLVMPQTPEDLNAVLGLRAFTPGSRLLNIRVANHPVLDGILPADLRDWRGASPLVPLAGPPADLDQSQRTARVWRCSQEGIVASTVIEKPHRTAFRPLLDTGFDLRYAALAECPEGKGAIILCQLDLVGRTATDPTARRLLANLVRHLGTRQPVGRTTAVHLLTRNATDTPEQLRERLERGETIVACGVQAAMADKLAQATGNTFAVKTSSRWKNLLPNDLPAVFAGVSPAETHWRRKLDLPVLTAIPDGGWLNASGVLAVFPALKGRIVWLPAAPEDFDLKVRPDLVYSRVATERLLAIVLSNLNAPATDYSWADALARQPAGNQADHYTDTRLERDDPYAYMRW